MALCDVCNHLQVDAITNELPEETNWPGPERLHTFTLYVPLQAWRESAEGGCATCRLIWDALLHFHKDLVLELSEMIIDDEPVNINISGILGQTLSLELYPLPKGKRFPGLEFYTSHSSPTWPIIGPAEEISLSLDLERCLELCKRWIPACEQKHLQCQSDRIQPLPTRVLDLGEHDEPVNVRLYEPPPNSKACYIALSYCWGKVRNLTTTSTTIAERKAGISWEVLSRSFRDAILICRGLGVRYLWIDALCIIQDSTSDWEKEAARMADVYENAFLTIATDAAHDPTWGILTSRQRDWVSVRDVDKPGRPREKRNYDVLSLPMKDDSAEECIVHVREPLLHTDIVLPRAYHDITYPLLTRAWTLQERLLARRTLHFTAFELVWECKETLFCECGCISREFHGLSGDSSPKVAYERAMDKSRKESNCASGRGNSDHDSRLVQTPRMPETTKAWTMMIGGYSVRQLSFVTDKLPAISGLARRYDSQVQESSHLKFKSQNIYLAGLWLTDLPWLLCWRGFQWRFEQRTAEYCAPTWSWASITTPVVWDFSIYEAIAKVEVMGATIIPQSLEEFGRVKGGSVTLRGHLQRATVDFDVAHEIILGLKNEREEKIFFVPDHNPPDANDGDDQDVLHDTPSMSAQRSAFSLVHGETVACLWVLHNVATGGVYGLVLASPEEASIKRSLCESVSTSMSAVFERVGIITSMSWQYQKDEIAALSWFEGAEEEVLTII